MSDVATPSVGVRELRASLAKHLARIEAGESLIVTRGARPIARLGPPTDMLTARPALEDMVRLGLIERPRRDRETTAPSGSTRPLPVDVRVDRIVRQIRG